jgi:hypothetical protein
VKKGDLNMRSNCRSFHLLPWLCLLAFLAGAWRAAAAPVSLESPIGFFTNVANRLLKTQSTLDLNRIQVYPANQYTPSIHRLLQLTANVYDCTTNRPQTDYPYLPSVFRPLFTNDNGAIYICGYAEETGTNLLNATMRDLSDPADRAALQTTDMVWGVPAIIGVKKGYPGFNKFGQQLNVRVTRRMQFRRPVGSIYTPVMETNLMYLLSVSNTFGMDAWNPYSTAFPRGLLMVARPQVRIIVTNELGTVLVDQQQSPAPAVNYCSPNSWPGISWFYPTSSFLVPVLTNVTFLPTSAYSPSTAAFVAPTNAFETINPPFYVPKWYLTARTRVCFALVDASANRIVDYVNLASDRTELLTDLLMEGALCGSAYVPSGTPGSMWCTNSVSPAVPSDGMKNQLMVSFGNPPYVDQADWTSSVNEYPPGMDKISAIDSFRNQFGLSPIYSHPAGAVFYNSNTFAAPYQPFRNIYLLTSWQANDPLLHTIPAHLTDIVVTNYQLDYLPWSPMDLLGGLSSRYTPWRYSGSSRYGGFGPFDATAKDPLITSADAWSFPTSLQADLTRLGAVHRGTPWQSVYLKSATVPPAAWVYWTGDNVLVALTNWQQVPPPSGFFLSGVAYDAYFSQPTNDWRIASLLLSLLGNTPGRALSSANQPGTDAWAALLEGVAVLTNNVPDDLFDGTPSFATEIMSSNSPQAGAIAAGIETLRLAQPGHCFASPGDILGAPALSLASPWLNLTTTQFREGISDEAYEAISAQLLLKLRPDSIALASAGDGVVRIRFTGADNGTYGVQVSSNLVDWTLVSTNVPSDGVFEFQDPAPGSGTRRFYRSILLP